MKNLHSSKRHGDRVHMENITNKHRESRARHVLNHQHKVKIHNHHSHLKRRFVHPEVTLDDQMKTWERKKCLTHEELAKLNRRHGKKDKKPKFVIRTFKFLDMALVHAQSFHDAMSKLARENQGIDVRIYVH